MRDIKFRAWDKKENCWHDSWCIHCNGHFSDNPNSNIWGDIPGNLILMQYTGLKDKNGKGIYEGDYLKYKNRTFEVVWCNGAFKLTECKSMLEGATDGWLHELSELCVCSTGKLPVKVEVIGNIFEGNNLLKEKI